MQRVWTVVLSTWAMLAIVAVLAWSHRPPAGSLPQPPAQAVVVTGANGKQQLLVLPATAGATHATTATSAAARP